METSFMYHCLGIREQECTRTRYEGGKTILEIRTREDKLYCPKCKSRHVIKSGSTIRQFKYVPIGVRPIILEMTVQRLECKYSRPDLCGLRYIGIDEFAVAKGHIYMTIVVDLETGRIVYVGEGKGADALDGLWPKLKRAGCRIETVSSDLSEAFISAVKEHLPDAALVLDDWIEQARSSGVKPLMTVADTFLKHHDGILAWYDFPITNGKLEGINNKIKTMKRQAYGYRDMPFFKLKLLSLHDSSYPFSG